MGNKDVLVLAEEGKSAFKQGNFPAAVRAFQRAAEMCAANGEVCEGAEMRNNLSVALLKNGQAEEALKAVDGTEQVFAQAGDVLHQGMAIGNQAAALEALGRLDEAVEAYERSAKFFSQAGEGDMQSLVLTSAGTIRVRQGKIQDSAIDMLGSLQAAKKPTLPQRILKFLLRSIRF